MNYIDVKGLLFKAKKYQSKIIIITILNITLENRVWMKEGDGQFIPICSSQKGLKKSGRSI